MRSWVGPRDVISAFVRRDTQKASLLYLSCPPPLPSLTLSSPPLLALSPLDLQKEMSCEDTPQMAATYRSREEAQRETTFAGILILGFLAHRTVRNYI